MAGTLLLVEDDDGIAAPLERTLRREGYEVLRTTTGRGGCDQVDLAPPDLVILDLGLPDMDGLDVCRELRDSGFAGPIMILTARGDELDRVVGLDAGADDYLAKPFGLAELLARVRSLLRRSVRQAPPSSELHEPAGAQGPGPDAETEPSHRLVGDLRVDLRARRVFVGEGEVQLSSKEFDLLALVTGEPGAAITRERIMEEVWDEHWFGSTKTLDVTLGRLRQKLAAAGTSIRIAAVRGVGFRLEPPDA